MSRGISWFHWLFGRGPYVLFRHVETIYQTSLTTEEAETRVRQMVGKRRWRGLFNPDEVIYVARRYFTVKS